MQEQTRQQGNATTATPGPSGHHDTLAALSDDALAAQESSAPIKEAPGAREFQNYNIMYNMLRNNRTLPTA